MLSRYFICIFFCVFFHSIAARAEGVKYALLIGNQAYTENVGPLKRPHQDVETVGRALSKLGFQVTTLRDADYREMDIAIKRYVATLRGAGPDAVGFFYYSGHGVANPENNINYLIPIDVERADTNDLWYHSFEHSSIIDRLNQRASNATHFIIFDACRNELNLTDSGKKSTSAQKGFVPVASVQGMLIAYATAERRTASDAGLFADILAEELQVPGVEAVPMFRQVQLKVTYALKQEPWLTFGTLPQIFFAGEKRPDVIKWTEIKDSNNIEEFEAYLEIFPDGQFAESARLQVSILKERQRDEAITKDWKAVEASTDIAALEKFISSYPDHPYAAFARSRINALREEAVRDEQLLAWNAVKDSGNADLLRSFIEKYPDSFFAVVAMDKMKAMESESEPQPAEEDLAAKFWEEISRANDPALFAEFMERFPDSPFKDLAELRLKRLQQEKVAALPDVSEAEPSTSPSGADPANTATPDINPTEVTKSLQRELDRVGCGPGSIDGIWGPRGRQAMELFNQHSGLALDKITPTMAAIDAIRQQKNRVCPQLAVRPPVSSPPRDTQPSTRPAAGQYARRFWPSGSVSYNMRVSRDTEYGRLTCIGGNNNRGIPRRCSWD